MLDLMKTVSICATIALVIKFSNASITSVICCSLVAIVLITHNDSETEL